MIEGAWALLLARYADSDDVAFGVARGARDPRLARIEVDEDAAVGEWLARVEAEATAGRPAGSARERLPATRHTADTVLSLEDASGAAGAPALGDPPPTPLLVAAKLEDTTAELRFRYDAAVYAGDDVARLGTHLELALRDMADPDRCLATVRTLTDEERERVLGGWNETARPYDLETTVHELFARQAARTPQAAALAIEGAELTYQALDAEANRLAHHLRTLGVGRGTPVALCLERSLELLIALLATLKAGAAYVPVATDDPPERIAYLLEDTGAPVLLTQAAVVERLPALGRVTAVALDRERDRIASQHPPTPPPSLSGPDDLAYVIYTSGSTGRPKGVQVGHRAVVNRLTWMQEHYALSPADRVLQKTPYTFDVSVWELLWPLLHGARLTLARARGQRDPDYVAELIVAERVTIAHFVPSALAEFLRAEGAGACTSLRQVVTSGEALDGEAVVAFSELLPDARLDNLYGPTECCVDVTAYRCRPEEPTNPPIGRPIANTRAYIVDRRLRPVPVGVPGELCIAGVQLARGYLNLPAQTAAAFVDCPFEPGERMYRTGDVCRWRADGEIEYLGRRDGQVKIRGHRIELGEIQARLGEHPDVAQAAVIVREDRPGERRVVAYVVPRAGSDPRPAELRRFLGRRLPAYMLPAAFVGLARLPLTAHAKLDRGALPAPGGDREVETEYASPDDPAEEALVRVWREVLDLGEIGVDDNFFELGGDSILGIKAVGRAREAGIAVSVRALFEHPTIRALAASAGTGEGESVVGADQEPLEGEVPIGPIQAEFLSWSEDRDWFNQSVLVELTPGCGPERVRDALLALIRHHDALRLRLRRDGPEWRLRYAPAGEPPERLLSLGEVDLEDGGELRSAVLPLQRGLDAERGPTVAAALLRGPGEEPPRLFVTCHHLAVDAVTWQILLEDLGAALEAIAAGEEVRLPRKTTSFAAWVKLLGERTETFAGELEMWERAGSHRTALGLEESERAAVETITVRLGRDELARLADAHCAYRTRTDELLACALVRALGRLTGEDRVRIDIEGHGREPVFEDADLTRTAGWFTALYPLTLEARDPEADAIKHVKEALRGVSHRGLGYGVLRHLSEAGARLRAQARADVVFNNLGRVEDGDLLGGLGSRGDRSPKHARSHPLTLAAGISSGELRVDLTFQGTAANRVKVERLGRLYLECLRELVDHCLSDAAGGYTASDFPLAALDQATVDRIAAAYPTLEDAYRLSPMQLGMLYHSLRDPDGGYYVQQDVSTVEDADREGLERAWLAALLRHPVMRTSIVWEGLDEPVQVVEREVRVPVAELDWRDATPAEREERRRLLLEEDRRRGFEFARGPLWRLTLIRVADAAWEVVWSAHHVLLDAWSGHRLREDVSRVLAAGGDASSLEPVRPLRDHIAWLDRQDTDAAERFWSEHLAGLEDTSALALAPPQDPRPGQARRVCRLSAGAARSFARSAGLTLNTVVQGAWALVLSRLTGHDDVVFGVTTSGRAAKLQGAEAIVGCLINTLPVRVEVSDGARLENWLAELQRAQGRARAFEYASLAAVQRQAGLDHERPLFDTILVFDYDEATAALAGVTRIGELSRTNYPLTIVVVPDGDELELRVLHDTERFDAATVDRLGRHLSRVLGSFAASPDAALGSVELLDEDERRRVVHEWNETRAAPPDAPSVVEVFERRAEEAPGATAVLGHEGSLTYAQLSRRVEAVAAAVRGAGAVADSPVGLLIERSPAMVAALLGVLRSGAAYLPLDPADPPGRIDALLSDAGAAVVVAGPEQAARHAEALAGREVLAVAGAEPDPDHGPPARSAAYPRPGDLAYVIYTSGSTGDPKGVAVEHRSLANLVDWMSSRFDLGPGDRILAKTPVAFDASIAPELMVSLCCGATMVLAPEGAERDPAAVAALIARRGVTVAKFVPIALAALLEREELAACSSLREVFVAGEPLSRELVETFYRALPHARLHNLYGPTETTVDATFHTTRAGERGAPPVGRPIAGVRCYVTDPALRPLPVGAVGELVVGGAGVSRGYVSDPALTAERFLDSPFVAGERVYRTGDRARRRADGSIELLGRADEQLKIRGHRVEPAEIRGALESHPDVAAAAVAAHPGGPGEGRRLTGYVVCAAERPAPPPDELRARLASRLPEYMVPHAFVVLESLPLTRAGKVDVEALPAAGDGRPRLATAYEAPATPTERVLAAVWAEVLGLDRVGVHDNLFSVGGDSILTIKIAARARRAGLAVTVKQLFDRPTIRELAGALEAGRGERESAPGGTASPDGRAAAATGPTSIALGPETLDRVGRDRPGMEDAYPLSPMQAGMLYHALREPEGGFYLQQYVFSVRTEDPAGLTRAWLHVALRHPVMRTSLAWEGLEQPLQVVEREVDVEVTELDWRDADPRERERRRRRFLEHDRRRGFDLATAPLWRLAVARLAEDEYEYVWSYQHLLLDGWSTYRLLDEIFHAFEAGGTAELDPVRPFRDFIGWLGGFDLEAADRFWASYLEGIGAPARLELPSPDDPRPGQSTHAVRLDAAALDRFARDAGVTANTVVQGAWAILLSRLVDRDDVVFGATTAGRPPELEGVESIVGCTINTLPVRVHVDDAAPARGWLAALQAQQSASRAYEHTPLSAIRRHAGLVAEEQLFDTLLVFENLPHSAGERASVTPVEGLTRTNYPVTIVAVPGAGGLELRFLYDTERLAHAEVERLGSRLVGVVEQLAGTPDVPLGEIEPVPASERDRLVVAWNDTAKPLPQASIAELFEQQARATPEAPAVAVAHESLSYADLNARSNRVAHRLRTLGVDAESTVGLAMERSPLMIEAMIGILKAGGAYVPVDPADPAHRLAGMLDDAGVELLLTTRRQRENAASIPGDRAVLALDADGGLRDAPEGDPPVVAGPRSLAYVMFTSGSTGRPKGVAVEHRSVVRLVRGTDYADLGPGRTTLHHSAVTFDASTFEIWGALLNGGRCVLYEEEVPSFAGLAEAIARHGVDTLWITASLFNAIVDEEPEILRGVDQIVTGGEAHSPVHIERAVGLLAGTRLVNGYGPTETTTFATTYRFPDDYRAPDPIPIGRPIANTTCYVVDRRLRPVPVGVPGELVIGGAGVARGYVAQPELTAERFLDSPFVAGDRVYRTGDLCRWRDDGTIEYLGRIDDQVKIRGFRVELGEIEAALEAHDEVTGAAVVALQDGDEGAPKRLVAYVVAAGDGDAPTAEELRRHCERSLPEFMLPSAVIAVEELPLNASGKLDRSRLPAPGPERTQPSAFVAPATPAEAELSRIWAGLLGVERVAADDNFFALGGDSIMAIRLVGQARVAGLELTVRSVFENPTLRELAEHAGRVDGREPVADADGGELPLAPIQAEFFEWEIERRDRFNQSTLIELGTECAPEIAEAALRAVARHHDALRLRFRREDGEWRQRYAKVDDPDRLVAFEAIDLSGRGEGLRERLEPLQERFDLERGPLIAGALLTGLPEHGPLLFVVAHHLVVDVVSWAILHDDLVRAIDRLRDGEPIEPGPATTGYGAWIRRVAERAPELATQLPLWKRMGSAVTPLPLESGVGDAAPAEHLLTLDASLTEALVGGAPGGDARVDEVLLAGLARAVAEWTGEDRVRLDLEGHGREALWEDLDVSRTVGWFTALYPATIEVDRALPAVDGLAAIADQLRAVPHGGVGYGVLRHLGPAADELRDVRRAALGFNYLGRRDQGPLPEIDRGDRVPGSDRAHQLSIDAALVDGRMCARLVFPAGECNRAEVERLAGLWEHELRALGVDDEDLSEAPAVPPPAFPLADLAPREVERIASGRSTLEDIHPLTPIQLGMLYHSLREPDGGDYVVQSVYAVQTDALEELVEAWLAALLRHPVMRSSVAWEDTDEPLQVVEREAEVPVTRLDWRDADADQREARRERFLAADRKRGFELARAPLWRLAVIRTGERAWEIVSTFHHLLLDGWSFSRLVNDALAAFAAGGDTGELEPVRPFRDYVAWLRRLEPADAERFWSRYLDGVESPTPLPLQRPDRPGAGHARHSVEVDGAALDRLARGAEVTPNTVVQGAWGLLLVRLADRDEAVFGATAAARPADLPDCESIAGCLINTLPVRVRIDDDARLADWLRDLQLAQGAARDHAHVSLAEVQRGAGVEGGEALFETVLVFENYPETDWPVTGGTTVRSVRTDEQPNYPITVLAIPGGDRLELRFLYDAGRFRREDVERLAGRLEALVDRLGAGLDDRLGDVEVLDEAERRRVVLEWNETARPYPDDASIGELFQRQARETPGAIAVAGEERALTYAELNALANRGAHRLRAMGVGRGTTVAVLMPRSPEMVVGMLAAVKAGGAYVPLDPRDPADRLELMLEDAGVRVALTTTGHEAMVRAATGTEVLCLDRPGELEGMPVEDPEPSSGPDSVAYVIFTSGSTGRPKGVAVEHRGVVRLVRGADYVDLGPDRVVLHQSAPTFDLSTFEVWGPLLNGGRCALYEDEVLSAARLGEVIARHGVDTMWLTVSLFNAIVDEHPEVLAGLRQLLAGGEAHSAPHVIRALERLPEVTLINGYGPTEATTFAAAYRFPPAWRGRNPVPIGRPIANTTCYVVDRKLRPMPIGVPGELVIGGPGVARGYVGRPELTAERFVPSPFTPGDRLYRTGDVCRWREDGLLEYLGRVDDQVKIRGFRVELGEIEAALESHPEVGRAAVLALADGRPGAPKRLVAYVAAREERRAPERAELRSWCAERLPGFMLPSAYVTLGELPLSSSGKLDRSRLPHREDDRRETAGGELATPVETTLARIWAEVLDTPEVGAGDDFFELGGDSISSIRVVSAARRAGVAISVEDVFKCPTVRDLATRAGTAIDGTGAADGPWMPERPGRDPLAEALPEEVRSMLHAAYPSAEDAYPLTPMQRGMLYHGLRDAEGGFYVQQQLFEARTDDLPALERAWRAALLRHPAMRTSVVWEELDEPVQVVERDVEVEVRRLDWRGLGADELDDRRAVLLDEDRRRGFDFARGPLWRLTFVRTGEREHTVLWTHHHLILDGWSVSLLISEVLGALGSGGLVGGLAPVRPFRDYVSWLLSRDAAATRAFWRSELDGLASPTLLAPAAPEAPTQGEDKVSLIIDSSDLQNGARGLRVTLGTMLQGAWALLLGRLTDSDDVVFGGTTAGRPADLPGVESIVGCTINTLPVRVRIADVATARTWLAELQDRQLARSRHEHASLPEVQSDARVEHEDLFDTLLVLESFHRSERPRVDGVELAEVEGRSRMTYALAVVVVPSEERLRLDLYFDTERLAPETVANLGDRLVRILAQLVAEPDRPLGEVEILAPGERRALLGDDNRKLRGTRADSSSGGGGARAPFADPATPTEALLSGIWADVLGADRVGADDDFFALGGDSIASMKAVSRARRAGVDISVKDLFDHPTVRELAAGARRGASVLGTEQEPLEGEVPLGPVQREFLTWQVGNRNWFNQSALLELDAGVSSQQLRRAVTMVAEHHDALRLRLARIGDRWIQRYAREQRPERLVAFEEVDIAEGDDPGARFAALQSSLDLERGPLVAAAFLRRDADRVPLAFVTCHHLAVDVVSWSILRDDLETLLRQLGEGQDPELPPKSTSYRAWVERLERSGATFEGELAVWERMGSERTSLPLEPPGAATPWVTHDVALPERLDEELVREAASRSRCAADDLLLAALAWGLAEETGRTSIRVDLEGHGRGPCFDDIDLSRTVGWFTALYPLTVELPTQTGAAAALRACKRARGEVPHGGLGYGVLRHLTAAGERLASQPSADVLVNFLGRMAAGPLPGVERHDQGPECRPSRPVTVTAAIRNGRFELRLDFVRAGSNRGTVERLGKLVAERLDAVVDHCLSSPAAGWEPSDFPLVSLSDQQLEAIAATRPTLEDVYPLSPIQLGMLYHSLRDPEGGHYVEQHLFAVDTDRVERLIEAWRLALLRHPVMRTGLVWEGLDEPAQVVEREVDVPVRELDWRDADPAQRDQRRRRLLEADRRRGFDLGRPPLWRLTLIRTGEREYELLWTFHHALLDGWSFSRLLDEALATFEAGGDVAGLDPVRPPRDYVAWLAEQDADQADRFWRGHLEGVDPRRLELPPPPEPGPRRARHFEELDAGALEELARRLRVTANTVVQGAWALVLSRLTGTDDVVFGATAAGRPAELDGAEDIVGCLINTLPVRVRVPGDAGLDRWLTELQARQSAARAHDHTPLPRIHRHAGIEGDDALFETLLVFENYPLASRPSGDLDIRTLDAIEQTNYPLTVAAFRRGEKMVLRFEYDGERLDPDAVRPLAGCLTTVLEGFATDPQRALGELELVAEADRPRLLRWSRGPARRDAPTVAEQFASRARQDPAATALEAGDVALTYGELAARAAAITRRLHELGAGPETRVALVGRRSPETVAAVLGILAAGAAYVPLDPTDAPERVRVSIEAAGVTIVAIDPEARSALGDAIVGRPHLTLEASSERDEPSQGDPGGPTPAPSPASLAYVVFTSGSTGRPKGVEVEHSSLANLVSWMSAEFGIGPGDRVLCKTPLWFDASIAPELLVSLCSGATMVLAPENAERDPELLCELIQREEITVAKFVPVALRALLEHEGAGGCRSLRHVFSAGDALAASTVQAFRDALPDARLHNLYGPTETTVDAAFHTVATGERGNPPIGRPIAGARCYVVDAGLRLLPAGVPGELAVGGAGVARGYADDPEQTAQRFRESPLGPGERVYLTGDRCRFRGDGELEFLGRRDDQLKVRGHRIEPAEVERALARHPAIAQAAVAAPADRNGEPRLASYVVYRDGYHPPSAEELRRHLRRLLPEYMVPVTCTGIERLPVTRAGKLDRSALPAPGTERPALGNSYEPPATPIEVVLADIFAEVLGLNRVGASDDVFALGGDSILAIKITARARAAGLPVTVGQLFDHPTIRGLAEVVTGERGAGAELAERGSGGGAQVAGAEQGPLEGSVPLTPTQIDFFKWDLPARDKFTSYVVLELEPELDLAGVEEALGLAVRHHDAFRLRFELEDSGWTQRYAAVDDPDRALHFASAEARGATSWESELRRTAEALQSGLDIRYGPTVAAATVDRGPSSRPLLFLAAHHLVVDSVSWRIVLEDFRRAIAQPDSSTADLPPKSTSFRGWAQRLRERADEFAEEAPFWLEMTDDALPLPQHSGREPAGTAATLESWLCGEQTAKLVREAPSKHGIQVHDVLLAALTRTVAEWRGDDRIRVDVQAHGRAPVWDDIDLTRTVGWFASTYPLTIGVGDGSASEALRATVRQLERVPSSGLGYGICRHLRGDAAAAELARRPRSPLAFNYLGRFIDEDRVVGLSHRGWRLGERTRYVLSLAALVTGGELKLIWSYHESLHDPAEIERLASAYERALTELVDLCATSPPVPGHAIGPSERD